MGREFGLMLKLSEKRAILVGNKALTRYSLFIDEHHALNWGTQQTFCRSRLWS